MKLPFERVYGWYYALAANKYGRADNARHLMSVNLISLLFPLPLLLATTAPNTLFVPVLVAGVGGLFWGALRSVNGWFAAYPMPEAGLLTVQGIARVKQALPAAAITLGCLAGGLYGFYALATLTT